MNIYGVTGWKNAGKTSLMERLVTEITSRGYTVSTVKHAHHATDIDHPGRDSYRHRQAGARQVILASPLRWAVMAELRGAPEPELSTLLSHLAPVDLVLVEGYKTAPHPKLEAYRPETGRPYLALENPTIRAIAQSGPPHAPCAAPALPILDLNNTQALADFVLGQVGLVKSGP